MFMTILIDKLVIIRQNRQQSKPKSIEDLQLAIRLFSINQMEDFFSLQTVLSLALVRSYLDQPLMENIIYDQHAHEIDILMGQISPPEYLLCQMSTYYQTYFLQSAFLYSQPDRLAGNFSIVAQYLGMMLENQTTKKVVFLQEDNLLEYNRIQILFEAAVYNPNIEVLAELTRRTTKSSIQMTYYTFACILINIFVLQSNQDQNEQAANLLKQMFIDKLSRVQLPAKIFSLYQQIISGDLYDFQEFLSEDAANSDFATSLGKLFYQFNSMVVCFEDKFEYGTDYYSQSQTRLSSRGLFATISDERRVANKCSLIKQLLTYRLDEVQTDTGIGLDGHTVLGTYSCSCGYCYGLGNCGRPNGIMFCHWCRAHIGGTYPNLVQRQGHVNIPTLEALQQMLQTDINRDNQHYVGHRILDIDDPLYYQQSLQEFPITQQAIAVNRRNEHYSRNIGIKLTYKHLFDHMYMLTSLMSLNTQQKANFRSAAEQSIDLTKPDLRMMANRQIHTVSEYFLAHIKNDIQVLCRDLGLRSQTEMFDWLRGAYSNLSERLCEMTADQRLTNVTILPPQIYVETPLDLLSLQD